ncbi:MAG: hypothetical protein IH602_01045 [Bryobacteraceae bacterium]|nr:hypothetical protein [Bryobacteraceae bacterium]
MAVWSAVKVSGLTSDFRLDPEYYRPDLLEIDRALHRVHARPLGEFAGAFVVGPFGSDFNVENYVEDSPYRYVRGKDVKPFFLQEDDNAYMPKADFERLAKYTLRPYDLLISVVGTLGNCAVVPATIGPAVFSCKSTVWRPADGSEEFALYLTAYLNCEVGQALIQRLPRGHVQTGLNLDDLRSIPVVEPKTDIVKRVAKLVQEAQSHVAAAKSKLIKAEELLVENLDLSHVNLSPQKCYSRRFSDLDAGNRFGAEYYMPCKKRVLDALRSLPHNTIAFHAPAVRDLWDPERVPQMMVRNFDVTHALDPLLDDRQIPEPAASIGSTKKLFQSGDVVISRLRSYLKEIAVVRTSKTVPAVGSSEFIVLRPTGDGLSPETLMVFLRCPHVQTILKWSQDGSNHPRFSEADLLAIPVPDAVLSVQDSVDAEVQEANECRRQASRLLERAKHAVEEVITSGARNRS